MNFQRIIFLFICLSFKIIAIAQQSTITKITAAEYFIDKDPGTGNGIAINLGISDTSVSFSDSASFSGLQPGYHTLSIRVMNSQRRWSIFKTHTFYVAGKTNEPTISKITAAEYFFDKDPGPGNGIALNVGTSDTLINFSDSVTIPVLYGKDHSLTVRSKNSKGNWSIFQSWKFSFMLNDKDRDGLIDYEEPKYGTDYRVFDVNNDGLADGVNVFTNSNQLSNDTDGDGISNAQEISKGTSPILADTDGDGVPDKKDAFPLDRYRTKLPTTNLSDHIAPVITLNEPPL